MDMETVSGRLCNAYTDPFIIIAQSPSFENSFSEKRYVFLHLCEKQRPVSGACVQKSKKTAAISGFRQKERKRHTETRLIFYQVKRLCEADSASIFKFNADIGNKVAYTAVIDRVRPELEAILVGRLVGTVNRIFRRDLRPTRHHPAC